MVPAESEGGNDGGFGVILPHRVNNDPLDTFNTSSVENISISIGALTMGFQNKLGRNTKIIPAILVQCSLTMPGTYFNGPKDITLGIRRCGHPAAVRKKSRFNVTPCMQVIKAYSFPFAVSDRPSDRYPRSLSLPRLDYRVVGQGRRSQVQSQVQFDTGHTDPAFEVHSSNTDKTELTVGAGYAFDKIYKVVRPENYNIVGGGESYGFGIDKSSDRSCNRGS
ncbi:hypothetical protein H4582DRAFT_2074027 [Lactarius indigo]|nr:hypothetical protein H4582DRAFT_2074027 [Lactarius indigo]